MSYGRDHGLRCTLSAHAKYWLLAALFAAQQIAHATTFTVTSTADTGGSTCAATCTLRQAINAANAAAGADTINFNITGTGLHTIAPASALPTITSPVTINGYSQAGSAVNTASVGTNAVLKIELNGANISTGGAGLLLGATSSPSTIRGLAINGFTAGNDSVGIQLLNVANNGGSVRGCFIGTVAAGTAAKPNDFGIATGVGYNGVTIGGTALADRNVISGNVDDAVVLDSDGNVLQGNLIGVAADGSSLLGNGRSGVLTFGSGNFVGGTVAGAGNLIAGNRTGMVLLSGATGVTIQGNAIYGNGRLGIDLSASDNGNGDGVTANDVGDLDTGANHLQNFPVLTEAGLTAGGGLLGIVGTLNSTASRQFRIEFFANTLADPSGFGEGQRFIGSTNVTTDASGNAGFTILGAASGVVSRQIITATAQDKMTGDTSEFSAGTVVTATTSVVNTDDSGPGSLRQAILNANSQTGADTIDFAIPGAGVHTIHLLTALPTVTDTVTIDGYTQLGAAANSLADGDDARILIRIDGSSLSPPTAVLTVCAINTTVRGLSVTHAPNGAIAFGSNAAGQLCSTASASGSKLTGSFIGIAPDGSLGANGSSGVSIAGSSVQVGGASVGDRNVLSGNADDGVGYVNSGVSGSLVAGNLIGWAPDGVGAAGNGRFGVLLGTGASGVTVGQEGAPNRIGNNGSGIFVVGNVAGARLFANAIGSNSGLGINLVPVASDDGVTANDPDDADTGANGLQNFPVISSVTRTATGLSISGFLDRPATAGAMHYTIAAYASDNCDPSGFGEGERFLGTFDFFSTGPGVENFVNIAVPSTQSLPISSKITMTATDPNGNTSEFSQCAELDAGAQTFIVNSVLDTNDGVCTSAVDGCTLREAINAANARAGGDTIAFNIPGAGVHIISPTSALPTIIDAVTIDGYTQPGAAPNTLGDGDDAKIMIQLDGALEPTFTFGFAVCASDVTLRGLSLTRSTFPSIAVGNTNASVTCSHAVHNARISGNFIGIAPDGSAAGNHTVGISINGGQALVGGALASERNVVSANLDDGIAVQGALSSGSVIAGNYIGTDPSGTLDRGNLNDGVAFNSDSNVTVGGAVPNRIAFNRNGIVVAATSRANTLFANEIFSNDASAIDLAATGFFDGVTPNDSDDGDSGGNDLQNFPVLASAVLEGATVHVVGTLDVPAGNSSENYVIALYASASCSPVSQGEAYLGYANVSLSGASQEFVFDLPGTVPIGSKIASTATSAGGTSEFSACVTLVGGDLIFANGFD